MAASYPVDSGATGAEFDLFSATFSTAVATGGANNDARYSENTMTTFPIPFLIPFFLIVEAIGVCFLTPNY
jgi:hypothetical protein